MVVGRRLRLLLALAVLGALLAALPAAPLAAAGPATYIVTSTADSAAGDANCAAGSCTLRQALEASNVIVPGAGNHNTITFASGVTGAIMLKTASGVLPLTQSVTITGPGADVLAIDGGCTTCDPGGTPAGGVPVFTIGNVAATITGLTIQHGNAGDGFGGGVAIELGGTVTLRDDLVTRNVAHLGGGIFNHSSTVIVDRTTFEGNTAGLDGGGIDNNGGILTVTDSTFANNRSQSGGAIFNFGQASVTATTIGGNGAPATVGGGIFNLGPLTLTGSIVAGNGGANGPDVQADTAVTDGGYNVIGSPVGNGFVDGTNHDRVGTAAAPLDPRLAALGGYGGANGTQTFALLPGSPALDTIPAGTLGCGTTLATDQRGIARPQPTGGACDSGSFEARYSLAVMGGSPQSAVVGQPFANPLAVTLTSGDGVTALGGASVTFTPLPGGVGQSATLVGSPATTDASGQASVTATANGIAGSYTVTASATGAASATFNLTNTAPPIALAPTIVPNGAAEQAYSQQLTASGTGSTPPFAFAVTTGTLPTGLTLDPTGLLHGTPTAAGSFPFTVTATDASASQFTGMQAYTITITAGPLVSIAVAPNPVTLKVGQVQQFTATGTYADNSTADLTSQATWSSDAPTIVSVDTSGKGAGKTAGTARVTATRGGVSGQTTVTVSPPVLTGVQPAPAPQGRPGGASVGGTPAPAPSSPPTTGGSAPVAAPTGR